MLTLLALGKTIDALVVVAAATRPVWKLSHGVTFEGLAVDVVRRAVLRCENDVSDERARPLAGIEEPAAAVTRDLVVQAGLIAAASHQERQRQNPHALRVTQLQNDAVEIQLRAQRRLGELTAAMPKQHGARGEAGPGRGRKNGVAKSDSVSKPPTLAEQGIDKRDASKWQKLAAIPAKKFDALVAETRAKGERLTSSAPLEIVRNEAKAELAAELRAKPLPQATRFFVGCRVVGVACYAAHVPPGLSNYSG